jgi:hypothetical protein
MFSFCSIRVKPHPPTGSRFFGGGPLGKIFATPGCVDVGEKYLPEGGRFCRTELAERRSGDDVRRDLVFDEGDAVAQLQFAFLQPL